MSWRPLLLALGLLGALHGGERPRVPGDELPEVLLEEVPLGYEESDLAALLEPDPRVGLGRRLFFWPGLSRDRSLACASCHRPELGFADDRARSVGVGGALTERNSPTLLGRGLGERFMWRGEAATLEEQVLLPIANPLEMDLPLGEAVERLRADPELSAHFERACGGPPSEEHLAASLAAFVRRLLSGDSPFDRFQAGERDALSPEERAGMWFFQSRGQCWRCHKGPLLSDEAFHNTGVGSAQGVPVPGRFALTGLDSDRGAFKTPTLREVSRTAPYMHDGSLATLEDVVRFYREGGHPNSHLDPRIARIEMSDQEAAHLTAFLRALTPR